MQKHQASVREFLKTNWILIIVLAIGLLLRWWQLPNYLFFGFEQGRDAAIIEKIAHLQDFTLVGPKTDLDGIFHGAWYYYLMVLPYGLGQGNPLGAIGFLILLHLTVIAVGYVWVKELTKSSGWAGLAALFLATSYELIIYSRWLSNAAVAVPILAFSLWQLWLYHRHQQSKDFFGFVASFLLASQFEIILLLHLTWLVAILLFSRFIRWPNWKAWLGISLVGMILFTPLFVFNVRNQWISLSAFKHHSNSDSATATPSAISPPAEWAGNFRAYATNNAEIARKSVLNLFPKSFALIGMGIVIILAGWVAIKKAQLRSTIILLSLWLLAALPTILFHSIAGLPQLYMQAGFAWVMLLVVTVIGLWQMTGIRWLAATYLAIVLLSFGTTLLRLNTNTDVFFKTIQDDLNYFDQRQILTWIKADAGSQPYRFNAFTIPYFQSQGWLYLQHYFNPEQTQGDAKIIYIAIEEKVEPYWRKKWVEDMGDSELLAEYKSGHLIVQKRSFPSGK